MDKFPKNAQNVVDMADFQSDSGYSAISQVEAYWEAVRGNRILPTRSDIDPRGIEQALEYAFILERIAPGIARLRIAGNHLNDLMGMEVRGMPLTAFFIPEARPILSDMLETVFQTPATGTLELRSAAAGERPELPARLLLLPLKSDLGDVSRVLGCFVSKGHAGVPPRRFGITGKKITPIAASEASLPTPLADVLTRKQPAPTQTRRSGLSEEAAPFEGKTKKRPPYLRLVKSDD